MSERINNSNFNSDQYPKNIPDVLKRLKPNYPVRYVIYGQQDLITDFLFELKYLHINLTQKTFFVERKAAFGLYKKLLYKGNINSDIERVEYEDVASRAGTFETGYQVTTNSYSYVIFRKDFWSNYKWETKGGMPCFGFGIQPYQIYAETVAKLLDVPYVNLGSRWSGPGIPD